MYSRTVSPLQRRRAVASAVVAVALALVSSSAMALGEPVDGEDDDDSAGKKTACQAIGCEGGERKCGKISGKVSAGLPPFVGEVAVSWTCYEKQPVF